MPIWFNKYPAYPYKERRTCIRSIRIKAENDGQQADAPGDETDTRLGCSGYCLNDIVLCGIVWYYMVLMFIQQRVRSIYTGSIVDNTDTILDFSVVHHWCEMALAKIIPNTKSVSVCTNHEFRRPDK